MNSWGGKREGSGRPRGRLNNRTEALLDRISEKYPDWCPMEELIEIARDKNTPVDLRAMCCARVAGYIYSKPKINIDANVESNIVDDILAARRRAGIKIGECV